MNLFNIIKDRVAILDLISQYTSLKKAGSYYKGTCPFHSEKTASFTVSPDKNIFYCFGCHTGGDVISFIAKAENLSQKQAAEHLAAQYGIDLPESSGSNTSVTNSEKNDYLDLCALVAQWCHSQLKKHQPSISYLLERGIRKTSMVQFLLGYMPTGKKSFESLLELLQKNNFLVQDLLDAKIFLMGKAGIYTPFENRIIFPIKDHLGRFCGFSGRIFIPGDDRAKYYNSHDHMYFSKGSLLFGLDLAKKRIQETECVFMVEGQTDVVMMAQHGYTNTVATLGTSCTAEHLKVLGRYAKKLFAVYDGDVAGQKALLKLTELTWQSTLDTYVIQLPKEDDPASFLIRERTLDTFINQAMDILTFYIHHVSENFSRKGLQERLVISQKVLDIINLVKDPLKQDLLLKQVSVTCDIPFDTLRKSLRKLQNYQWTDTYNAQKTELADQNASNNTQPTVQESSIHEDLEKKIFSAIINEYEPLLPEDVESLAAGMSIAKQTLFRKILHIKHSHPKASIAEVLTFISDEEKPILSGMLIEETSAISLKNVLVQWYRKEWKNNIQQIKLNITAAEKLGDSMQVKKLLNDLDDLKKKMLQRGIA